MPDPRSDPGSLAAMAGELNEAGRYEEAITCCTRALEADPVYLPALQPWRSP